MSNSENDMKPEKSDWYRRCWAQIQRKQYMSFRWQLFKKENKNK